MIYHNKFFLSNPFQRIETPTFYYQTVTGFSTFVRQIFASSEEMFASALQAEVTIASDSGSRNNRASLATNHYLKFCATKHSNFEQVPLIMLAVSIAFIIFGDSRLRSMYNDRVPDGSQIPKFVQYIETNIRETQNNNTIISFSRETKVAFDSLRGTILDKDTLLNDKHCFDLAVTIINGNYFNKTYLDFIEMTSYTRHNFMTENCFAAALNFVYEEGIAVMKHFPFHTIRMINNRVDPTITDGFIAMFSGIEINDVNSLSPVTGSLSSYFQVNIGKANYFVIMFNLLFSDTDSKYCNSESPRPNFRNKKNSGLSDSNLDNGSSNNISTMAVTSFKGSDSDQEFIRFMNNLYNVNQSWFATMYRRVVLSRTNKWDKLNLLS